MADLIKIKAGSGNVPTLQDRELAYRKDEQALYIGTGEGNVRLCGGGDLADINTKINNINTQISEINTETNEIRAEINALRTEINGVKADISNINAEIAALNGLISNINARLDALTPSE